jgi:ribosomal protein S18 acetylase RimI-like enzyme
MITIELAEQSDIRSISNMAHIIWPAAYGDILSQDQIDFMLEKSYTVEGLAESMVDGQFFYVLKEEGVAQGFVALRTFTDKVRIEKLYLMPDVQGKGFGKVLIDFAFEKAMKKGKDILELNVNRNNPAYHFYLKQGFKVVETVDIPYYDYVLNDYVMQKEVKASAVS